MERKITGNALELTITWDNLKAHFTREINLLENDPSTKKQDEKVNAVEETVNKVEYEQQITRDAFAEHCKQMENEIADLKKTASGEKGGKKSTRQ